MYILYIYICQRASLDVLRSVCVLETIVGQGRLFLSESGGCRVRLQPGL